MRWAGAKTPPKRIFSLRRAACVAHAVPPEYSGRSDDGPRATGAEHTTVLSWGDFASSRIRQCEPGMPAAVRTATDQRVRIAAPARGHWPTQSSADVLPVGNA